MKLGHREEILLQTLQILSEMRRNHIMVPVRYCFYKAFTGLPPSPGWQLHLFQENTALILMRE